ncbi:efflux RND transporter periplasmic adaptor subunit [Collinsella tanakaei]|uniref:Uncharacterized protein n=1 Tax=Collinsella tanakaei YIT 12063 TaxID=742742 RepID=G1WG67_9ACTN|nr:efflux RND transporter periplasmic adaptor subunit [Collinsella tanakaei]EGX67646.1 hypothetical protein HMPREF9452_00330 [Collinsella tanakaei YIT 12063]
MGDKPIPDSEKPSKLANLIPVIKPGKPADDPDASATVTMPVMTAESDKTTQGEMGMDASDAEAYAKLKARRAERRKKKLVHRAIIAGITIGIVAIGGVAYSALNQPPAENAYVPITDAAFRGTYSNEVDAKGTLEPLSSTVVSPTIDGTIATVNVSAGQAVAKGDVLMTIKNDELDRAIAEAARSVEAAKADLATAKRGTDVVDEGGNTTYEVSQDNVDAAKRALAAAQEGYDQAVAKAAERTVTAPCNGNIVEMNAQVGASATGVESGKSLMQIADLSQMKVTVQVSEEDIAKVAVGQTANVTFPAFPDLTLQGSVTGIASIASADGGTMSYDGSSSVGFDVDILIAKPDYRLKPGMTAKVSLVTEQLDDVIMVPSMALMTDDGQNYYVMVQTDAETQASERRDVTVVTKNDDFAVIGKPAPDGEEPQGDPNQTDPNASLPESAVTDGEILLIGATGDTGIDGGMSADSSGVML